MNLLRSSILGKEFINYRKHTKYSDKLKFKKRTTYGEIPVVVDSVDKDLTNLLISKETGPNTRNVIYGLELIFNENDQVKDVLRQVKIIILKKHMLESLDNLQIGTENGDILDTEAKLHDVYNKYKNNEDRILYLLLTKEKTMYSYIMSIVIYLKDNFYNYFMKK